MELNAALNHLGIDLATLPTQRVAAARKAYLHLAKSAHPDHGGDPAAFLSLKEAWDVVQRTSTSTSDASSTPAVSVSAGDVAQSVADALACFAQLLRTERADEDTTTNTNKSLPPPFCVEPAVRSTKCQIDPLTPIPPGALRFGSYHPATHSYTNWSALKPGLEIPARVHMRLSALGTTTPSVVQVAKVLRASKDLVRGIEALAFEQLNLLATLCLDKARWAPKPSMSKKRKALKEAPRDDNSSAAEAKEAEAQARAAAFQANFVDKTNGPDIFFENGYFRNKHTGVPITFGPAAEAEPAEAEKSPSEVEARTDPSTSLFNPKALAEHKFVLSGVFDFAEAKGGLAKGKGELELLITKHGGKTVSAVSAKTTALLVGRLPGGSKITAAKRNEVPILDVGGLFSMLRGTDLKDVPRAPLDGVKLSKGFGGNGVGTGRIMGPPPVPALAAPQEA